MQILHRHNESEKTALDLRRAILRNRIRRDAGSWRPGLLSRQKDNCNSKVALLRPKHAHLYDTNHIKCKNSRGRERRCMGCADIDG